MENSNLNNEQFTNPLLNPLSHSIEELLKEIQFGRPAETQLQIQKWIDELTQEKLLGKTISKEVADKDSFEKEVAEIPDPSHFMKLGEDEFNKNVHEKLRAEMSPREKIFWLNGYLLAVTQYRKR